jgi:hypothetical protein
MRALPTISSLCPPTTRSMASGASTCRHAGRGDAGCRGGALAASKPALAVLRKVAMPFEPTVMKATRGRSTLSPTLPVVVFTSVGARSGERREVPLAYFTDGDDVIAYSAAALETATATDLHRIVAALVVNAPRGIWHQLPDRAVDRGGCRRASAGTARGGFLKRTGRTDPVVNQNSMNTTS